MVRAALSAVPIAHEQEGTMVRATLRISIVTMLMLALAMLTSLPVRAQNATPVPVAGAGEMAPIDVVAKVSPAVVTVINEQTASSSLGINSNQLVPVGSGSGFIIDNMGHVVTNNHVVEGGQSFQVVYSDGTKVDAKLIGADPVSDLAVVQVSGNVPGVVSLGDSNTLKPGQGVLAMGSPLGIFANTVTQGIVSGLGRSLPQQSGSVSVYTNLIQHDAPINPGNSGGPLFDLTGQVMGVNTIAIPVAEQGVPAQGLFFAIPSNTVKKITDQLVNTGQVIYPYLGISGPVAIDPVIAAQNNLPVDHGVFVTDVVPDGPAAQAGIQPEDIITEIDGQTIDQNNPLEEFLFDHKPGDTVTLTIQRGDQSQQVQVTLGQRPSS
jgi:2-alkenal reductase